MEKEIDVLLRLFAETFAGDWTDEIENLFTMLLETKAGIRS